MKKHAFLIIAHNDFELLKIQLKLLDDIRNDIYIHIDLKSNFDNFNSLKSIIKKSNINIYKEINVRWGDKSQVECELFLLKKASENNSYQYYHILSGADLPIKTQEEIHDFFDRNNGKEFIHFDSDKITSDVLDRVIYRHFFSKYYKCSKSKIINKLIFILDNTLVCMQKILNIKKNIQFNNIQKGCNWCSITDDLVKYILSNEKSIMELIKHSKCADEIFIQTIVENSLYREKLYIKEYTNNYESCLRMIIWNNDSTKYPHTFVSNDWDILKNSNALFARKFSTNLDKNIINKIYDYLTKKGEK